MAVGATAYTVVHIATRRSQARADGEVQADGDAVCAVNDANGAAHGVGVGEKPGMSDLPRGPDADVRPRRDTAVLVPAAAKKETEDPSAEGKDMENTHALLEKEAGVGSDAGAVDTQKMVAAQAKEIIRLKQALEVAQAPVSMVTLPDARELEDELESREAELTGKDSRIKELEAKMAMLVREHRRANETAEMLREGKSQMLPPAPPAPPYYPFHREKFHTRGNIWIFTVG